MGIAGFTAKQVFVSLRPTRRLGCNDVSLPVFTVGLMYVAAPSVLVLTLL